MTLSKFLTYWSLTFAILLIWIFSIAVAMADVKDELLARVRKQMAARLRALARPVDPLAARSVAETLTPSAMDERESWVFHLVSELAIALRLGVRILVLQDSMGHYVVHFAQGKRLVTYRVDKAWVTDAMAGKPEARERIHKAIERYLRQEFLGETPAPAAGAAQATARPSPAAATPGGSPPPAAAAGGGMSREEKIAAARARAEAIKAQRAAGASGSSSPGAAEQRPETAPSPAGGTPRPKADG